MTPLEVAHLRAWPSAGGPWWPDHALISATDSDCQAILDRAVACLILVRGDDTARPRRRHLHSGQPHRRLDTAIPAARHRFAGYGRRLRQLELFDRPTRTCTTLSGTLRRRRCARVRRR